MKIASLLILISTLIIFSVNWLNHYKSAFEADQACHELLMNSTNNRSDLGCDHDLETRQWILYEKTNNYSAANVLNRFRY